MTDAWADIWRDGTRWVCAADYGIDDVVTDEQLEAQVVQFATSAPGRAKLARAVLEARRAS